MQELEVEVEQLKMRTDTESAHSIGNAFSEEHRAQTHARLDQLDMHNHSCADYLQHIHARIEDLNRNVADVLSDDAQAHVSGLL